MLLGGGISLNGDGLQFSGEIQTGNRIHIQCGGLGGNIKQPNISKYADADHHQDYGRKPYDDALSNRPILHVPSSRPPTKSVPSSYVPAAKSVKNTLLGDGIMVSMVMRMQEPPSSRKHYSLGLIDPPA